MSSIIFRVPLICAFCGSLNDERSNELRTAGVGYDSSHTFADIDDVLDLDMVDFGDGYLTLRRPPDDETTVVALEVWGCRVCLRTQAARLRFERVDPRHCRFVDAKVVPFSSDVLDEAHFISRRLEEWSPNPGDDVERVRAIIHQFDGKS